MGSGVVIRRRDFRLCVISHGAAPGLERVRPQPCCDLLLCKFQLATGRFAQMEDAKKMLEPGADPFQYGKMVESHHLDIGKEKEMKNKSWHYFLSFILVVVTLFSSAAVVYLGVAHRDCLAGSSTGGAEVARPDTMVDSQAFEEQMVPVGHSTDESEQTSTLLEFVATLNCSKVSEVLAQIHDDPVVDDPSGYRLQERIELHEYVLGRASELNCELDSEIELLGFPKPRGRTARGLSCRESSIGDGWCHRSCNNNENEYDMGDCCPHACTAMERYYPCGINGYDCKIPPPGSIVPSWFKQRAQLCYSWYADGDGGQCGGGAARLLCAGVNHYTNYYRDDTDGRGGGCRMRWAIMAPGAESWFNQVKICYKWYADGDGGQCGGGAANELCASVNSYTAYYRDDTDGRGGGCRMSWQLRVPSEAPSWIYDVKLCYEWYADGDGGQCGGGASRILCAYPGQWTSYYRDDTDGRGGGCRMKWGLFV